MRHGSHRWWGVCRSLWQSPSPARCRITREKAARKVAEFFGTTAWYAAGEYGYMSWACKDQQGRVWKFQRDISIHGPEAEKCEMVTPILTYEDIETLQAIIRLLRKAGAKSSPSRGCGVHIHIGKGNHTPKNRTVLPSGRPPIP